MYRRNPRADAERLSQVLAGLGYPAAKWQILMHAENHGADACTRADLWSLPTGEYRGLAAVLAALRDGALPHLHQADQAPVAPQPVARYTLLHPGPQGRPGHRRRRALQVAAPVRPLH